MCELFSCCAHSVNPFAVFVFLLLVVFASIETVVENNVKEGF